MRSITLACSIVVHLTVFAVLYVSPLLAIGDLPAPAQARAEFLLLAPSPSFPTVRDPVPVSRPMTASSPQIEVAPTVPPDAMAAAPAEAGPGFDLPSSPGIATSFGDAPDGLSPPGPPPAPAPPQPASVPQRVGGDIKPPARIEYVAPAYPPIARAAGIAGSVILEATIAEDGTIQHLRVLRSVPLLDDAAVDAVRRWRFTPTQLNGRPIPVLMTVTVTFALTR